MSDEGLVLLVAFALLGAFALGVIVGRGATDARE